MNIHPQDFKPSPKDGDPVLKKLSSVSRSVLHGCNPYFHKTVILEEIDLGSFNGEIRGTNKGRFADRFAELFLTLPKLIDEPKRTQNFYHLLSTSQLKVTDILLEAIVAVEEAAAAAMHRLDKIEFAQLYQAAEDGHIVACWSTNSPSLSRQCAETAIAGVNALLALDFGLNTEEAESDYQNLLDNLLATTRSRRLTTTVCVIREAAKQRNIECAYLGTSYLRLGQGKHQLYFRASLTGKTSHTASQLSVNKRLATRTLRVQRLPVPEQMYGKTKDMVQAAAERIGYPVIVKPLKGYGGHGVTLVTGPDEIGDAYDYATEENPKVIVEEFIEGDYFRLLVINNEFVAALRVAPPEVTGDGHRTIRELVDELNEDPFRDDFRMVKVDLDERLTSHLSHLDLDLESVLPDGRRIALREIANVSQGGYSVDVTDNVHNDYAEAAVHASKTIGLDVAGIDFITKDITRSFKEVGGAIIEVNSRPGLGMHAFPRYGTSRDVGKPILNCIFPPGTQGNISTSIIVGEQRTAVVARDLDEILRLSDCSVGLAIRSKAFVNGVRCDLKDGKHLRAVRTLIRDPNVDTLISTQAPAGILRRGLQFDKVDVAAIRAPLPETDPHTYKEALAVLLKAAPNRVVCGARNDLAVQMLEPLEKKQITLVTRNGLTRRVRKHLSLGGHAVVATWVDGMRHIEIYEGETLVATMPSIVKPKPGQDEIRSANQGLNTTGHRSRRVETRLFAIALALGFGLSVEKIRDALAVIPTITK